MEEFNPTQPKHFVFNKVMIAGQVKYIAALELKKGTPEHITIYVHLNDDWAENYRRELASIRVEVSGKAAVYVYNNIAPEDTVFIIGSLRFIKSDFVESDFAEGDIIDDLRFTYLVSDNVRLVEKNQEPIEYPIVRVKEPSLVYDHPREFFTEFWER